MIKKTLIPGLLLIAVLFLGGCQNSSNTGNNGNGSTPDPVIGLWLYTATGSSGPNLPEAQVISIADDGSFYFGMVTGSSGSYNGGGGGGTWAASSSGYSLMVYGPTSATDPTMMAGTGSLSSDHKTLTLSINSSSLVYNAVAAPSSDPIISAWVFSPTGSSGTHIPTAQIMSMRADGSFYFSNVVGSSGSYEGAGGAGTWTVSGGVYTIMPYQPTSNVDPALMPASGSLSSDHKTLTVTINGGTLLFSAIAAPATDPIAGTWIYTSSGSSGLYLPIAQALTVKDDGSFIYAMVGGSSGSYQGGGGGGTWTDSSGSYTFTTYQPTSASDPNLMAGTASLSTDKKVLTLAINSSTIKYNKY